MTFSRRNLLLSLPFLGVRVATQTTERGLLGTITIELNGPNDERVVLIKNNVSSVEQSTTNPDHRVISMNNGFMHSVTNTIDDIVTGLNR